MKGTKARGTALPQQLSLTTCSSVHSLPPSNAGAPSMDMLRQAFHLPSKTAAKHLGISPSSLKKICRRHNFARWPQRKLSSLCNLRQELQRGACRPSSDLQVTLDLIDAEFAAVMCNPDHEVHPNLTDARDANHKLRSYNLQKARGGGSRKQQRASTSKSHVADINTSAATFTDATVAASVAVASATAATTSSASIAEQEVTVTHQPSSFTSRARATRSVLAIDIPATTSSPPMSPKPSSATAVAVAAAASFFRRASRRRAPSEVANDVVIGVVVDVASGSFTADNEPLAEQCKVPASASGFTTSNVLCKLRSRSRRILPVDMFDTPEPQLSGVPISSAASQAGPPWDQHDGDELLVPVKVEGRVDAEGAPPLLSPVSPTKKRTGMKRALAAVLRVGTMSGFTSPTWSPSARSRKAAALADAAISSHQHHQQQQLPELPPLPLLLSAEHQLAHFHQPSHQWQPPPAAAQHHHHNDLWQVVSTPSKKVAEAMHGSTEDASSRSSSFTQASGGTAGSASATPSAAATLPHPFCTSEHHPLLFKLRQPHLSEDLHGYDLGFSGYISSDANALCKPTPRSAAATTMTVTTGGMAHGLSHNLALRPLPPVNQCCSLDSSVALTSHSLAGAAVKAPMPHAAAAFQTDGLTTSSLMVQRPYPQWCNASDMCGSDMTCGGAGSGSDDGGGHAMAAASAALAWPCEDHWLQRGRSCMGESDEPSPTLVPVFAQQHMPLQVPQLSQLRFGHQPPLASQSLLLLNESARSGAMARSKDKRAMEQAVLAEMRASALSMELLPQPSLLQASSQLHLPLSPARPTAADPIPADGTELSSGTAIWQWPAWSSPTLTACMVHDVAPPSLQGTGQPLSNDAAVLCATAGHATIVSGVPRYHQTAWPVSRNEDTFMHPAAPPDVQFYLEVGMGSVSGSKISSVRMISGVGCADRQLEDAMSVLGCDPVDHDLMAQLLYPGLI